MQRASQGEDLVASLQSTFEGSKTYPYSLIFLERCIKILFLSLCSYLSYMIAYFVGQRE